MVFAQRFNNKTNKSLFCSLTMKTLHVTDYGDKNTKPTNLFYNALQVSVV